MFRDPNVDESIVIAGNSYTFMQVPETPGIVYAEMGKKAKVYRIRQKAKAYALKVFKPVYRNPTIVVNTGQIAKYKDVPGLAVAERIVLTPENYPGMLTDHPEYSYAVLMPWIEGKVWVNYICGKIAINRAESLSLAKTLLGVMSNLEDRDIAHCDLSGGNFIFSTDYTHVELIDIEELFGIGLQRPNPLPAGSGGYAPLWIRQNGLWAPGADRFSTGILVIEILGWQFEDVRASASTGEAFFTDDEFGHETARYNLLIKHLGEIHHNLPHLLKTTWRANKVEECPSIAEWNRVINQVSDEQTTMILGWESINVPIDISATKDISPQPIKVTDATVKNPFPQKGEIEQTLICPACGSEIQIKLSQCHIELMDINGAPTQPMVVERNIPQPNTGDIQDITARPWPNKGGGSTIRRLALFRVFMIFAIVGMLLLLFTLHYGGALGELIDKLVPRGGMIIPHAISNGVLALLVGTIQAWIFRHQMRESTVWQYILASTTGGIVGGAIAGEVTNLGIVKDALLVGAIIGATAGTLSSLLQNPMMRSSGLRTKWFLFSLITWTLIWTGGMKISWSFNSTLSMALASAFILISCGLSLVIFLYKTPELEF